MPRQRQLPGRRTVNPEPEEDDEDEGQQPSRLRDRDRTGGIRRRRPPAGDDDDDYGDPPPRRSRETGRKRSSPSRPARESGRGFDKLKQRKARSSRFNSEDRFTVEEKSEELIVFLEDEPFETWNEHFLRELDGKKSWVCLNDDGKDQCPLCEIGDNPSYRAAFNIAVFDEQGNPEVKFWIATPGPLDEIEEQAFGRSGPLNKPGNYYVISKKKGSNNFFKYKIERLTAEQVEDEFGFEPLDEQELDALLQEAFESSDVISIDTRARLREIAMELS